MSVKNTARRREKLRKSWRAWAWLHIEIEAWISAGRVKVNGAIASLGVRVDLRRDCRRWQVRREETASVRRVIIYNKLTKSSAPRRPKAVRLCLTVCHGQRRSLDQQHPVVSTSTPPAADVHHRR
jgi:16S rRNA U516 pseudouridylate synthase RsuA-like enzyme